MWTKYIDSWCRVLGLSRGRSRSFRPNEIMNINYVVCPLFVLTSVTCAYRHFHGELTRRLLLLSCEEILQPGFKKVWKLFPQDEEKNRVCCCIRLFLMASSCVSLFDDVSDTHTVYFHCRCCARDGVSWCGNMSLSELPAVSVQRLLSDEGCWALGAPVGLKGAQLNWCCNVCFYEELYGASSWLPVLRGHNDFYHKPVPLEDHRTKPPETKQCISTKELLYLLFIHGMLE